VKFFFFQLSNDRVESLDIVYNNAKYELTAVKPSQYPKTIMPEVVFLGRSNVGKSTLINCLLNRKHLARVASTPGKTRGLNFYNVDEKLYFVDIPGYGYAKVSKQQKANWPIMIDTYINTRKQVKLGIMLLDIRHTPSMDDKTMYNWLVESNKKHVIVATKADKVSKAQAAYNIRQIKETLNIGIDVSLIKFSSRERQGSEELWNKIKYYVFLTEEL